MTGEVLAFVSGIPSFCYCSPELPILLIQGRPETPQLFVELGNCLCHDLTRAAGIRPNRVSFDAEPFGFCNLDLC